MNPINNYNQHYGNSQQPMATILPHQPITSIAAQPTPIDKQQQYEVGQVQPTDLHLTYDSQFPPINYQPTIPQQLYYPHIPPPAPQQTRFQIATIPHTAYTEDLELDGNSDTEIQDPIHEWQMVKNTKKRKIEHNQKKADTTKQTLITTNNRFETLNKQTDSGNGDQTPPTTQPIPKPPPIFVYGVLNYKKMIDNLSNVTDEETYQCKILQNDTVKINAQNPDTYRKLIRHLNSEKIIHHTYQMKQDRAYRVVIRNLHYSIPIDEIKEELQQKGHPVRNVFNIRHRVNKHPLSMFYVDLEPKDNNKEIYNLQYLNNMKINVEPPNRKNTIIQCTRCQLYGHSKTYCTRPHKCVKCGGSHMTIECQKPKETPPKCALCSGEHTANYKGCAIYKDIQNARGKRTNGNHPTPARQTRTTHIINPPTPQQHAYPNATYSQILHTNHTPTQPDNLGLQLNTFLTEFKAMINQLINQNSMILSMLSTVISKSLNTDH